MGVYQFYQVLTRNLLNIGFYLQGSHLDPAGHDEQGGEDLRPGGNRTGHVLDMMRHDMMRHDQI